MSNYKKIDWVICAAGSGTRFKDFGIDTPKPLIKIHKKTFLEKSIESLDIFPGDKLILIAQKKHNLSKLVKQIRNESPWIKIKLIEITKKTKGQLDTFLYAEKELRKSASTVIWNCDTYFKSHNLNRLLRSKEFDGVVPCGKLPGNRWSFFKINKNNIVIDVKEKKRIAPWCSIGLYHFNDPEYLVKVTKKVLKNKAPKKLNEYYVSSLYPHMIKDGKQFLNCEVELFLPFGTVTDIKKYWKLSLLELKENNRN